MPQFMPPFMNMMNPNMRRPPMSRMPMPGGPRMNMMPMRPMGNVNMFNNQPPRSYTQPQQQRPPQASGISAQNLAKMTPEEQKNALGERLYAKIMEINPNQAAKITGMLLEMETGEILNVLEDQRTLISKVNEAITVLQQHEATTH
jgi:polyadenylate-binding protein